LRLGVKVTRASCMFGRELHHEPSEPNLRLEVERTLAITTGDETGHRHLHALRKLREVDAPALEQISKEKTRRRQSRAPSRLGFVLSLAHAGSFMKGISRPNGHLVMARERSRRRTPRCKPK